METMKVKICPFCGHHGHELLYFTKTVMYKDGEYDVKDIWQMGCKCCGARGPTEYSPRFAIESWNMIYHKPAHGEDPKEVYFDFDEDSIKRMNKEIPYDKQI